MQNEPLEWTTGDRNHLLDFSRPLVMGIINVTPDSFSDGGRFLSPKDALELAERHLAEGADILDVGAETTRPGSDPVSAEEEWSRLAPVLAGLRNLTDVPISVDTYKSSVADQAIDAGASIINDVYAGREDSGLLRLCAERGVLVILMHMKGEPKTMQLAPHYDDVVREVREFLLERAEAAMAAGVPKERIVLDPGLGFGKNADHNLTILDRFDEVVPDGFHSMMALSRKAFLGRLLDLAEPSRRDAATATANALAVAKGAEILRVHNVAATLEAARVAFAVRRESLI
jgi:dihydropteroate synthase